MFFDIIMISFYINIVKRIKKNFSECVEIIFSLYYNSTVRYKNG